MYRYSYPSNHNPNQLNRIYLKMESEQYKLNKSKDFIHIKVNQVLQKGHWVKMSCFSLDSNKPDSIMIRLSNTETKESYQLSEGSDQKYGYLQNINILLL